MPISRGGVAGLDAAARSPGRSSRRHSRCDGRGVEGGKRHQHERGRALRPPRPGRPCRNPCRPAARRAPVRERRSSSCRGWPAGRAARLFRASANISGRTSTSERIGQKPETIAPGSTAIWSRAVSAMSSEASMRQVAIERVAAGERFQAQLFFQVFRRMSCARTIVEPRFERRLEATFSRSIESRPNRVRCRREVTIHTTGGEVDPGNLQSRWAPYDRTHGSWPGTAP